MIRPLSLFSIGAALLCAQQPTITNADLRQVTVTGGLEATIRSTATAGKGPAWLGYAVPAIPREGGGGCEWNGKSSTAPVRLEGPTHVVILLRFEQGVAERLRVFSPDCPLDGGGLAFYWLSGVKPAESVAMLVQRAGSERKRDSVVHAIAMHAGPEAQAALVKFAAAPHGEEVRKSALFWLANSRGREGYAVVSKAVRDDPSDKVREHAVFALTQSREPEAIPTIVRAAKEDKSPHVRGQALFWLSQKASKQAPSAITEAIEHDPDTEVKKKAVFALSRLPNDDGVPRLIQLARTHSNPVVRKQAMFWLGKSQDPRAIALFEQLLK